MTVRSAAQELSALPSAGLQAPARPPAARPRASFTYHVAFGLSLLVHGLVFTALSLIGIGPRVALGYPWGSPGVDSSAFTLVTAPASSGGGSSGESERALDAESLERVLEPVELEAPPVLPDTADVDLAELDLVAVMASLRGLPLEPEAAPSQPANPFSVEPRSYSWVSRAPVDPSDGSGPSLAQLDASGAPRAAEGSRGEGPGGEGSAGTGDHGDGEPAPLGLPNGTIGGYLPPRFAGLTPPDYPHAARRLGHEGSALIRIQVSADGRVLGVELLESSGHELLDQAALDAARTWRFHPATQGGVAIAGSLLHRVTFRLEES